MQFEELDVWQESQELCCDIYKEFKGQRDWGFKDQVQRASISVMNNIAEGFERRSSKEFLLFLNYSKGSCGEIRSMLSIARKLEYITDENFRVLTMKATRISKMLFGLMKKLENTNQ
jgi:four helix bundle protein